MIATSFRLRILLWYTLVATLSLVLFRFATVQVIRQSLYAELDASLDGELVWIKGMLETNKARNLPDSDIRHEILTRSRLSPRKEFIEIYDPEGREYFRSPNLADSDTLRLLVSLSDGDSLLIREFRNHQLRMIGWKDAEVEIYVAYPLTDVDAALEEIVSSFLFLIPGAILLFVAGGLFLGTRFVKPLKDLRQYAATQIDLPLDRDVPELSVRNRDEVGLLIEQINQMVQRMRSSMRHVLSFSTLASHELRTPLTIMRNELEEALREGTPAPELQAALVSTYDEILRLARTVDELLELGTMRAGTLKLDRSIVSIETLLNDFCDEGEILCRSKGITLDRSIAASVSATIDATRIRSVLFNLLDNAIKATPPEGRITIVCRTESQRIVIEFSDTGPGLTEEEIGHIFDPFRRGSAADSGGSGLGLALSRWVIEAHGGTIGAEKSGSGLTTFRITLPATPQAARA